MNKFVRKEPFFNVRLEGDYSNWALAGFYNCGDGHDNIEVDCICSEEGGVTSQQTRVKNISDKESVRLNHVSSMLVRGIGDFDNDNFTVYICHSTWQGEMQWNKYTLNELGIYEASNHVNVSAAKISFNGSQTTSEYYPMIMIEDKKSRKMWFFEIEPASGWYFEIGTMGEDIYVEANSAFFCNDSWSKLLAPGETYVSSKAFFGCADGGFEEAVAVATAYKRHNSIARLEELPVVFNDYMNCLWAKPSVKKLLPLIDSAAEAGCEIFCIDDGWFESGAMDEHLGDWFPNDNLFGSEGFAGIVSYIEQKGMECGVWLEMESCAKNSKAYSMFNDCLLRRNGIIIGGNRAFFDFREERVREYTIDAIDKLYASGVRFIKNDYNHNICIGCDGADSLSEGLAEHRKAFLDFIDCVKQKYPDLIIESCSSGAMRMDYGLVKHMDLQSVSDQELYYNNPSIAAGALSVMPPEKCGFWSYPYPLLYENQPKEYEYDTLDISSDKEETIFNMINSMLGIIYLSGHIELCDGENATLIKEGIALYKTYRKYIPQSELIYLTQPLSIGESGVMSIGLKTEIGTIAAVWKINSDSETIEMAIPERLGKKAELIYPVNIGTKYCTENGVLKIEAPDKYMARLFIITDNGGI